jgi:UDP-2,3-diacylglucosamine pyrophosphatase LpxH
MNSIGNDIIIEGSKSVIVVADTHLGVKDSVSSRPLIFSSFMEWVKGLEEKPCSIKLGFWGEGRETKDLKQPQYLILLGDILELWDASDRSVDACSRFIFDSMAEMQSTKAYVLGNHDYDLVELIWQDPHGPKEPLKDIERNYPIGRSQLQFFDEVFPRQMKSNESGRKHIRVLQAGNENYLFIHGHQFDALFTIPHWRWMPSFRTAAMVFGSFTWVFVVLFFSDLILSILMGNFDLSSLMLIVFLACVSVPFLLIQFGRKVWNRFRTRRYKRKGGLQGFVRWWRSKFLNDKEPPEQRINVVYGHTHLTDVVRSPDEIKEILGEETSFQGCLLNLPAWSKDLSEKRGEVLQAVCLYIDEEGSWFLGWDWVGERPFLIPKQLVKERRDRKKVVKDEETAEKLEAIGWPGPLIEEWKNPSKIV